MKANNLFYVLGIGLIIFGIILGVTNSLGVLSGLYYTGFSSDYNKIQCTKIILSYIFVISGLIISFFILFFLIKDIKKRNKKNCKFMIWLSLIGLFTSIFIGAILEFFGSMLLYYSIKK